CCTSFSYMFQFQDIEPIPTEMPSVVFAFIVKRFPRFSCAASGFFIFHAPDVNRLTFAVWEISSKKGEESPDFRYTLKRII
ncbi:hypothetical protein ACB371_25805, partial [Klebsiella pneumoniae]